MYIEETKTINYLLQPLIGLAAREIGDIIDNVSKYTVLQLLYIHDFESCSFIICILMRILQRLNLIGT